VPDHKRERAGMENGFRVLPYRMQDSYGRHREPLTFRSVVLENDLLVATFLPQLGGRLISLFYKPEQRELLARNPVFQPANLALRNAWFSGGIEWNVGQYGHALSNASPIFAARTVAPDGEVGLRLYDFERCKGLFWQIDFRLPPGSPYLMAWCRVINPSPTENSVYWWNNIAVDEAPDVRVLAPSQQVIYVEFSQDAQAYGWGQMPFLPTTQGRDASYATNFTFASEYFFQCEDVDLPWEAALDGTGQGLIEASTPPVNYRKMFCWGMHAGGRHWQEFLSIPGHPYLEIQSGMTPMQATGLPMPPDSAHEWMQVFGYLAGDPDRVHDADYARACAWVDSQLKQQMPATRLAALRDEARVSGNRAPAEILHAGSGWGALEMARRALQPELPAVPPAFAFPESTLTADQEPWLQLLHSGTFVDASPVDPPGEWMVQPDWLPLLADVKEKSWFALLHEGVMRMENGDVSGAEEAWQASIALQPSPWAWCTLAVVAARRGDEAAAQAAYEQAWALAGAGGVDAAPIAVEALKALVAQGRFAEAQALYDGLPPWRADVDRIQILRGRIALELGDLETVEEVLQREYAVIREGETELSDLWLEMWMRREAEATGRAPDADMRRAVWDAHPLPPNINFLMFDPEF
jgi:hypothetical protein